MSLQYWCLVSILSGSRSLLDAVVSLLVDVFVDKNPCGAVMDDPQSFQSTQGVESSIASEDNIVVQTRALLDVPAPGDVKKWMDNFFLNQAYGAFCMNIFADIFVRLLFFVCTYLALLLCWRKRERETRLTDLQIQQSFDNYLESQKQFFETYLCSDSFVRRVSPAATSGSLSSLTPAASVPDSQVQANSSGEQLSFIPIIQSSNAGISPACVAAANSTNALPTECEKVVTGVDQKKGPFEQLLKRRNGYVYDCHIPDGSRSFELASSSSESCTSQSRTNIPTQGCKDVVIDIPAICVFPTSASIEMGNTFKHILKVKVGVSCDHDISSSRILQARVRATDENLSAFRHLAVEGMKLDTGFTLQIGGSFLYYCNGNPEEPMLLSLRDVEVPIVLQADYSSGVLTIRGKYLEGAEVRAATFDGYMILKFIKQDQTNNSMVPLERRVEVWRCTDLLPPVNLDQIQICASKTVLIEGQDVTVRSEVLSIQNTSLRTVIRNWVPTAILIVFLASQAWIILALLLNLITNPLHRTWLLYPVLALAIYSIQLLPPSLEDNIKAFVERLKLAISSFHVLPDLLSSPAFIMRNGYCFQRGAKHLVDCKLLTGGPNHRGSPDGQGSCDSEKSIHQAVIHQQEELSLSSNIDETPATSRDWNWPCFREEFDLKTKQLVNKRFYSDSKQESHDLSDPFTVTYSQPKDFLGIRNKDDAPLQYVPKKIVVKLYSKYLQAVTRNLLPSSLKLFPNYGEIQAKDLFLLYIRKAFEKEVNLDSESNDPLASIDGSERECLDMFHLIRFLKKEYGETITQYERMMEGNVISWDMLWTLIVPKADVIYYCDVSKEELCGKVLSTDYKIDDYHGVHDFKIKLEVSDYNCINFETRRISRVIVPFKEEVKIIDIDIYPLKHKADPQKAEELFLTRGRKFFDLVLKYERRFMQYQGLIYHPSSRSISRNLRSKTSKSPTWKFSYKENADGRVMIDQGGFVKINTDANMNTAQPSTEWLQGFELKMKVVIDESNPLLKYSPAIAYGYSFAARRWGCFTIDGFSEIQFISTAFDMLVMNEDIKNTLLTLTEHHVKHQQDPKDGAINVDPLPNKGKGCIILLHGPPGTGKTLTVESLAEKLECPLWQLSVDYDNSRSTEKLETDLLKTFEVAASWRAILLMDEADVYLSTRKYSPMSSNVTQTNAMTGAFLRILEYYTGILFLTTNVTDSIESAIYSRMSLFVKYEEFTIDERKLLWVNFLNRIGFQHPSQEFWDKVLPKRFNGRVIRNIIQNAQILAESDGCLLSEVHLLKAFQVMATHSAMSRLIEAEDKSDPKELASTTISTHAPRSVLTDSTLSQLREQEYPHELISLHIEEPQSR